MNPHILIIEDEREIAELVELSLARAHFTARIAPTAEQARQLLARERFDLLLLDVGLPDDGKRRVPGLRRQEVADLAGVSLDYYTRLERGRVQGASDSVLMALAEALRLNDVERVYLLALAHTPAVLQEASQSDAASVRTVLDHVTTPAMAGTVTQDVIAANLMGRALYARFYETMEQPNLARFAFLGEAAPEFYGRHLAEAQLTSAAMLRMELARHPGDERLTALIAELEASSESFRTAWARQEVHEHRTGVKTFHHHAVGDISLAYHLLIVPGTPGAGVTVYNPIAGTDAERQLDALRQWALAQDFARTAPEPDVVSPEARTTGWS